MKRLLLLLALFAAGSASASAAPKVNVFVFAESRNSAVVSGDGFIDPSPRADPSLADSVHDIQRAIAVYFSGLRTGVLHNVDKRREATIFVQVMDREEINGAYVVHARATFKDHHFELAGSSIHQWKESARQIAEQLADWVAVNRAKIN